MKKNIYLKILLFIIACIVMSCLVSVSRKKAQIEERETKVLDAIERAITALENYRSNDDFNELQTVIKELEVSYKYLREIEEIKGEEKTCWDISMAVGQLKSYDSTDEIKALDHLALGLQHMQNNIYNIGNGYFLSFVNKNSIDEE